MNDIDSIARALAERIGAPRVIQVPHEVAQMARDLGEPPALFRKLLDSQPPELVVRPETPEEVAAAVQVLVREKVPFTPRGIGSTGLGGAVPVSGGVAIDLSHLKGVREIDPAAGVATIRAGSTFYFAQQALEEHGLVLRSRPTNAFGTLGGWAAAGGLGLGSLGAGPVREQARSIQVVRPDGSLERLDSGGEGFDELFDTEGQLGIFTELTLELDRVSGGSQVAGLRFDDLAAAVEHASALMSGAELPRTVMLAGRTAEHDGLAGVDEGELMLIEAAAGTGLAAPPQGADELPAGATGRLWQRRFFPMDNPLGPVFLASEAIFPAARVPRFVRAARKLTGRYGVPLHGHSYAVQGGDEPAILVLLTFPADPRQGWHHLMLTPLAAALTAAAVRHGGKPYGVGIWNTPFARRTFGDDRLRRVEAAKRELDPDGLLNPGKFFRVGTDVALLPTLMSPGVYPASLRMAGLATPMLMKRHDPSELPSATEERCIACGACVPVCLAVAATGAESVSGRAKLALMRRISAGDELDDDELLGSLRCLKCGQCAEVCARSLELLAAWEELEGKVRERVDDARFREIIQHFAAQVDDNRDELVLPVALP